MLESVRNLLAPAALDRMTLLLNHVLAAEPAAMQRLQGHAGRTIRLQWDSLPPFLPALPAVTWRVTPPGLLERLDTADAADLNVGLDGSRPFELAATLAAGERPSLAIQGDSGFAADVAWLAQHVRWDVEDDLARLLGDVPARAITGIGRALRSQLAGAAKAVRAWRGSAAGD